MMVSLAQKSALGSIVICILWLACGAKSGLSVPEPEETDVGQDASQERDVGPSDVRGDTVDAFSDAPPPTFCVPFDALAGGADLDIFVLMDFSASMDRRILRGPSKKDAVTNAVEAFVNEESSRGLGVSLTFFPFDDSSYPRRCTSSLECDCIYTGVCQGAGGTERVCESDEHCALGQSCVLTGDCLIAPFRGSCFETDLCAPSPGTACRLNGRCANPELCGVESYRLPAVPLGTLPSAARSVVRALRTREPGGSTPTLPALEGIIEQAREQKRANPERTVVVLLATDGLPSSCDPTVEPGDPPSAIIAPVRVAVAGAVDGIATYVIGVFQGFEEADARENLSRLAIAGGTNEANIISTASAVSEELLEELNRLRRSLRTCAYTIPAPGTLPRPEDVRVRLVREVGGFEAPLQELGAVGDASMCDDAIGGFYFRQDGQPRLSVVELCPSSCTLGLEPDVRVRIDAICTD